MTSDAVSPTVADAVANQFVGCGAMQVYRHLQRLQCIQPCASIAAAMPASIVALPGTGQAGVAAGVDAEFTGRPAMMLPQPFSTTAQLKRCASSSVRLMRSACTSAVLRPSKRAASAGAA